MKKRTTTIAIIGLLFALAIVLSYVESLIPSFVPGIKLGLSNIVVMFCLFYLGSGYAACLVLLKSGFVLLIRGATAAIMSFSGGILSLVSMIVIYKCFKGSYLFTSIIGGVFHNIGQIIIASILLNLKEIYYLYLPVLIISGLIVGLITGRILQQILPSLRHFLNK